MSFIAQLEAVGGLAHWAVYAALHIPDAAERARVSRACDVVQASRRTAALLDHSLHMPG